MLTHSSRADVARDKPYVHVAAQYHKKNLTSNKLELTLANQSVISRV